MAPSTTNTTWNIAYDTVRRENLFRHPPQDRTAYPALQLAVDPHIESFDALFRDDGKPSLIAHALADIGIKKFFDGDEKLGPKGKNCLSVRFKEVILHKSTLPPSNKLATNRDIYPAECRERHATYRGRLSAILEYQINDSDPVEFTRELGQVPIMVKVCLSSMLATSAVPDTSCSRTDVI